MNWISIILLALAGIIILAAICIPSFQEKIFSDPPSPTRDNNSGNRASIAGFLTVSGVTFLVIIIALSGLSVLVEIKKKKSKSRRDSKLFKRK